MRPPTGGARAVREGYCLAEDCDCSHFEDQGPSDAPVKPSYEQLVEVNQRLAQRLADMTAGLNTIVAMTISTAIYRELDAAAKEAKSLAYLTNPDEVAIWLYNRALSWKPADSEGVDFGE